MSGLVDRHIAFLEALRGAGLSVSLAEDLDAVAALSRAADWDERADRARRRTPPRWSRSRASGRRSTRSSTSTSRGWSARALGRSATRRARRARSATTRQALADFRERLARGAGRRRPGGAGSSWPSRWSAGSARCRAAVPGCRSWSAYTALQRVSPAELVDRIVAGAAGRGPHSRRRRAAWPAGGSARFTAQVEDDARRRIAEEKGPDHVADVAIRPSIDRLDFTAARKADLEEMRREIYPLARRLATRLTQEHHARRRGPLDFRRTVRASISTGGVPLVTHHKPKRPHRTELVVLCDVSGSVANFAQFTLLLVFALRDQFQKVRAFTFIDHVHEVTQHFKPGADVVDVMADLAASTVARRAVGPHQLRPRVHEVRRGARRRARPEVVAADPRRRALQLHRPARSTCSRSWRRDARHAWWLNPEHRRHWDTGDSVAGEVRRGRADGRVPQPHPARRVRARHPLVESIRGGFAEQKRGDCFRGLTHRVVGGREVVDLPLGIGFESGAEFSERRPVFPSRAVDELAARDLGRRRR